MVSAPFSEGLLFATILVAVKFSQQCEGAVAMAAALARLNGSRLIAVHALDPLGKGMERGLEEEARGRFRRLLGEIVQGVTHSFHIVHGDPGMLVCRTAVRFGADLVVLGAHENPKAPSVTRLGLIGARIVEQSPCPVLIVPAKKPASVLLTDDHVRLRATPHG